MAEWDIVELTPLHRAVAFAAVAHLGVDLEGVTPLPYLTHPIEVLWNLRYVGGVGEVDMLCAAVLHDVVEESPSRAEEIEKQFGPVVAALVAELTREEPTAERVAGLSKKEVWQLRSEMLLAEISKMSSAAQAIKLADRLSNVREAKRNKRDEKLKRYLGQTARILEIVPESVNSKLWRAIKHEL